MVSVAYERADSKRKDGFLEEETFSNVDLFLSSLYPSLLQPFNRQSVIPPTAQLGNSPHISCNLVPEITFMEKNVLCHNQTA